MAADYSDRPADSIERLASAIDSNTQEMEGLRDAIDDLHTEYVHAIRNAECPYLAETKGIRRILPSLPLDDALEMELTPDQIRQAIAEGVTTTAGLRRVEKNSLADEVPESMPDVVLVGWSSLPRSPLCVGHARRRFRYSSTSVLT